MPYKDPEKRRQHQAERYIATRAAVRAKRRLEKYGVSEASFAGMVINQGGRCAVCGDEFMTYANCAVDHNHNTGLVRGLLCDSCNLGLGKFRDDPRRLERAAAYVRADVQVVS